MQLKTNVFLKSRRYVKVKELASKYRRKIQQRINKQKSKTYAFFRRQFIFKNPSTIYVNQNKRKTSRKVHSVS